MDLNALEQAPANDGYLYSRGAAWFAFGMTMALMIFDYVDRQVIVSLFPYLKAEWQLSDKQLGGLVSIVSITVALGALPVALFADRVSRVKSIVAMATAWSLATVSCMWARSYGVLFAARAMVGVGEAGYGSVGSALIVSHFPARMRGALMAGFFACASVGSVLGVMLGGVIASKWGWQAAFGVVGVPGLVLALLYLKVRDYPTVALAPELDAKRRSVGEAASHIARLLVRAPTMLWVCIGGASQLIVVSALWAWLPSFLNRVHGIAPAQAGVKAALVVLCCAAGAVVWGAVADRAGTRAPRRKLAVMAGLCIVSMVVLASAFALVADPAMQFAAIALGGFFATCTVGPVVAIALDVTHPGVRSTGASVLALFQNLFGLAMGPFLAGMLSDAWGIVPALSVMPVFALAAAGAFLLAARSYERDKARAHEPLEPRADLAPTQPAAA
jgi:MFS family permease